MPNPIKYTTGSESLALKKGNFYIGTGDVGKGPTSTTGYYNGITPPSGGYTIYLNKATGGPSIYTCANDTELISLTNSIASTSYTTISECFSYYIGQSDKICFNSDVETIPTDGLIHYFDPKIVSSYPQTDTTCYNLTERTQNGSMNNGLLWTTSYGGVFSFDGTDDQFRVLNTTGDRLGLTNSISLSIWFKWDNDVFNGTGGDILLFGFDSPTGKQLNIYRNPWFGTNRVTSPLFYYVNTSNSIISLYTTLYYVKNQWYHICCSLRDNGEYEVKINNTVYLNSVATDFVRWTVNFSEYALNGRSGLGFMAGEMGPFMVWNRGISSDEMTQIWNSQKGRFGL